MALRHLGFALALSLLTIGQATAVQIQQWERIPLAVPLIVGQERIVFVDQNVRVGVPPEVAVKLRIQSTGGAIYLRASEPIPPTRLQLQNVSNGEIMLVDIMASAPQEGQVPLEPVRIVAAAPVQPRYGKTSAPTQAATESTVAAEDEEASPPKSETPVPVVLTRYAAQMLYAPLRTVEPVDGISQVRTDRNLDLTTLMPGHAIHARAIGTWRLGNTYVSAVKLRNTSARQVTLDPRHLMGSFVAATFQHPYLGAMGNATDTTTVYLVTQGRGLKQSLLPSTIGQIDPQGARR